MSQNLKPFVDLVGVYGDDETPCVLKVEGILVVGKAADDSYEVIELDGTKQEFCDVELFNKPQKVLRLSLYHPTASKYVSFARLELNLTTGRLVLVEKNHA